MERKPSHSLRQLTANSHEEKCDCRTILLDKLQRRHIPKRNRTIRVHPLPARQLLPFLRHGRSSALRDRLLSGPPRPVRLQALHSRQLLLLRRPLRTRRRLSRRLLLKRRRVLAILHSVLCRPGAAPVRPAQLRSVSRRQLLLDCRPVRSYRRLLSRLLLLRQRSFPKLHRLSLRQFLSAPCDASSIAVSRRQLLPLHKPDSSHAMHPRNVLRRHRPRCGVGQLRSRLLQQRRRCDVSLHEVPAGTVPGHGGAGIVQGMSGRRVLHRRCTQRFISKLQHRNSIRIVDVFDFVSCVGRWS